MVKKVRQKWAGVKLPESIMKDVDKFVAKSGLYVSKNEFVRDAARRLLSNVRENDIEGETWKQETHV